MKLLFSRKTFLALAVVIATSAASVVQAQDQPMPPPATGDSALPPDIDPNSPLAQVIKLVQAGTDVSVISSFVVNSANAFDLDADKILTLKDAGVPTNIINAMMEHDKNGAMASAAPPAPPAPANVPMPGPAPAPDAGPDTAPPAAPVTVEYFNTTLTPYGSWVSVDGYGRCWRPTEVIYNNTWRPYCDRGHWVYTDCGWYWDSDYAWGTTFHYGRWFHHDRFGWCWTPDTEWAPSWVTWRSSSDYCGWAPLPPFAVFRPGVGFFYRGASVAIDFNFGLGADCFTFVPPGRFCDRRPRQFCVEPARVTQVFNRTTIINNYNVHNRTIVNGGISVDRIRTESHQPIASVTVGSLPNARREGWRGAVTSRPGDHAGVNNNNGPGRNNSPNDNRQLRPGSPVVRDRNIDSHPGNNNNAIGNNNAGAGNHPNPGQNLPTQNHNGLQPINGHTPSPGQPDNRNDHQANGIVNHNPQPPIRTAPVPPPIVNNGLNNNRGIQPRQIPSPGTSIQAGNQPSQINRIQPHQFTTPPPVVNAPVQHSAPPSPQMPQHPSVVAPPARSFQAPPAPAAPPSAPAQNQGQSRSSGSDRGSDRDKQNH